MGCVVAVGLVGVAIAFYGLFVLRDAEVTPEPSSSSSSATRSLTTTAVLKNNTSILVLCCWTHFVIGFGFFTLQQWMPLFLNGYVQDLKVLGLISSLPWMGTALVSAGSGKLSLYLARKKRWSALRIRKFMQTTSSLGIAACLLPLAVLPNVDAPDGRALHVLRRRVPRDVLPGIPLVCPRYFCKRGRGRPGADQQLEHCRRGVRQPFVWHDGRLFSRVRGGDDPIRRQRCDVFT